MSKTEENAVRLRQELKSNEDIVLITSVEDLLTAWIKKQGINQQNDSLISPTNCLSCHNSLNNIKSNSRPIANINSCHSQLSTNRPNSSIFLSVNKQDVNSMFNFAKQYIAGYASAYKDTLLQVIPIAKELGFNGKVLLKSVKGKEYVIIKGYAGLRSFLTGTRYLSTNPKMIQLGIGKIALKKTIRGGGLLTIALTVSVDIFQALMGEMVLRELGIKIASDVVKVGITTVIAEICAMWAAGTVIIGTIACGPLIVGIGVGVIVGFSLDFLDSKFGITDKVVFAIEKTSENLIKKMNEVEQNVTRNIYEGSRSFIYHFTGIDVNRPYLR